MWAYLPKSVDISIPRAYRLYRSHCCKPVLSSAIPNTPMGKGGTGKGKSNVKGKNQVTGKGSGSGSRSAGSQPVVHRDISRKYRQ